MFESSDDFDGQPTTRRVALRNMGKAGLVTMAGAGFATLLKPGSAHAADPPGAISRALVPGTQNMTANCCANCVVAENKCYNGTQACPNNGCCYYCQGCNLNKFLCIPNQSCNQKSRQLC